MKLITISSSTNSSVKSSMASTYSGLLRKPCRYCLDILLNEERICCRLRCSIGLNDLTHFLSLIVLTLKRIFSGVVLRPVTSPTMNSSYNKSFCLVVSLVCLRTGIAIHGKGKCLFRSRYPQNYTKHS